MKTNNPYLLLTLVFLVCCGKENEEILEVPQTNIWTEKAKFPGGHLSNAVSFVIDDKLFVGTGINDNFVNYFYVFNYTDDSWKAIASLPSYQRSDAIAFTIGKYGYVGLGMSCIGSGFCTTSPPGAGCRRC